MSGEPMAAPNDVPEQFRIIRDELGAEELARLQRVQEVMNGARENGIVCTGRPDLLDCPIAPFCMLFLHGQPFLTPCIDCIQPALQAIMKAGHGACRQGPLADYPADWLAKFSVAKKQRQIDKGAFIMPEGRYRRESEGR